MPILRTISDLNAILPQFLCRLRSNEKKHSQAIRTLKQGGAIRGCSESHLMKMWICRVFVKKSV
jgi:hypothetical protein